MLNVSCFTRRWKQRSRFAATAVVLFVLAQPVASDGAAPAAPPSLHGAAGLCVLLGAGDGARAMDLAAHSRLIVHVLETDAGQVARFRRAWQAQGRYGQVSIEHWTAGVLPYADHLINVLIAESPGQVPEAEMLRVLAPEGTAWIQRNGRWRTLRQLWPEDFDEWTHARHGADGNMVSRDRAVAVPTGLRWIGGPPQDAGGRRWYYDHVLVSAHGRNFYLFDDSVAARDAFNGALLWSRRVKPLTFREVGTEVPSFLVSKARLAVRTSKVRPVAVDHRLYLAADGRLAALDAASGETLTEYGRLTAPRELLVESNHLVVSDTNVLRAYDVATARLAWEAPLNATRMVAGDGRLFVFFGDQVQALDLASGQPLWRTQDSNALAATTCTYGQGVLVLETSSWRDDPGGCGLLAFSGQNGRRLWQRDHKPSMTHFQETRAFFTGGLLWLQAEGNKVIGLEPLTGRPKKSWRAGGQHCATPVATERFFIAPECDFTDWETGAQTRTRLFKNACRLPFIPANGLLYSFPVQCECYPMLRGYMGLSADGLPPAEVAPRLRPGPAYARPAPALPTSDSAQDWPMYRCDVFRSASAPRALPTADLNVAWTAPVAQPPATPLVAEWEDNPFSKGLLTAPVIAHGLVLVAVPDEHRIAALDAVNGTPRWSFTAGARIDTPPTLFAGLCLFGAHDGWVYCLHLADGALAWRFRAAPQDTRILTYGQVESLWPVAGSVLVDQGVAYLTAGRHPHADGGVQVTALQARSGQLVWETTARDLAFKHWYGWELPTRKKVGLEFEPVDLLVKDGTNVAMSRWSFGMADGASQLALDSTTYQAVGLTVPRGLWSYGVRARKFVQDKPPAVFDLAGVCVGTTNDVALALAGGTLIRSTASGELQVGARTVARGLRAVHDGLAVAGGRIYVSTQDGRVVCLQ
jgi:outer membrane protein assembly factor BamB